MALRTLNRIQKKKKTRGEQCTKWFDWNKQTGNETKQKKSKKKKEFLVLEWIVPTEKEKHNEWKRNEEENFVRFALFTNYTIAAAERMVWGPEKKKIQTIWGKKNSIVGFFPIQSATKMCVKRKLVALDEKGERSFMSFFSGTKKIHRNGSKFYFFFFVDRIRRR